jgi:hypothetical protein
VADGVVKNEEFGPHLADAEVLPIDSQAHADMGGMSRRGFHGWFCFGLIRRPAKMRKLEMASGRHSH